MSNFIFFLTEKFLAEMSSKNNYGNWLATTVAKVDTSDIIVFMYNY